MSNTTKLGSCICTALIMAAFTVSSACSQNTITGSAFSQQDSPQAPPPLITRKEKSAPTARTPGQILLRPNHPQRYVIAPEDSLLDVASRFLEEPWRWPEVWRPSSNDENNNLLYPGEVIELYTENGQPRLRPASEMLTIKLSPRVRAETLVQPIPTVPRSAVEGFLKKSIVVNKADWKTAPIIVGNFDGRVLLPPGDQIYVYASGVQDFDQRRYRVFHFDKEYRDPSTGQSLGFGGLYVGEAVLEQEGDPAVLALTETHMEGRAGDHLFPLPIDEVEHYHFLPQAAPPDTTGHIIALLDDHVLASQYQSVIVNLGERDGMEPGYMLNILATARNTAKPTFRPVAQSPEHKIGSLMLYKVYEGVSYGLVMAMNHSIRVFDRVEAPF